MSVTFFYIYFFVDSVELQSEEILFKFHLCSKYLYIWSMPNLNTWFFYNNTH